MPSFGSKCSHALPSEWSLQPCEVSSAILACHRPSQLSHLSWRTLFPGLPGVLHLPPSLFSSSCDRCPSDHLCSFSGYYNHSWEKREYNKCSTANLKTCRQLQTFPVMCPGPGGPASITAVLLDLCTLICS